jgi:hypothetical protein
MATQPGMGASRRDSSSAGRSEMAPRSGAERNRLRAEPVADRQKPLADLVDRLLQPHCIMAALHHGRIASLH